MSSIFFKTIKKISSVQLNEITISSDRCIQKSYKIKKLCSVCQDNCEVNAININELVEIDWNKCINCGVCAAVCPTEVFKIQAPSDNIILNRLIKKSSDDHISIECNFVNKKFHGNEKRPKNKNSKIFVTCIGRFSEMFLLQNILSGVDRTHFVNCTNDCQFSTGRKVIDEMWRRTEHLVMMFKKNCVKNNNIESINDKTEQKKNITETRKQFLSNLSQSRFSEETISDDNKTLPLRLEILELIKQYSCESIRINRENIPFGEIKLSIEKCKLHGKCASVCPTNALILLDDNNGMKLNFRYGLCVGCGVCTYICPEEALDIEKTIDISQLNLVQKTIMEKKYVFCKNCGKHFSVKMGMNRLICDSCNKREYFIEKYAKE